MGSTKLTIKEVVEKFNLLPHPEGGFYAETFRDNSVSVPLSSLPNGYKVDRPSVSTAIYFVVPSGKVSKLHRIPSAEVWHFYYGDPLTVLEIDNNGNLKQTVLGTNIRAGQTFQHVVPPGVWFGSFPTNDYDEKTVTPVPGLREPEVSFSVVGCTVAPGFEFADFELASRDELLKLFPQHSKFVNLLTE